METYYARNKEKALARAKRYRENNPNRRRELHLLYTFGLSLAQYDALLEAQGGVCAVCFQPETQTMSKTGTVKKLAVDHCHSSGTVRGLLCQACNTALGKAKESTDILRSLINYLEKHAISK